MAQRYGLVPPGRARFTAKPTDPHRLRQLVDGGATERQIAADFGVSVSTVRKHLKGTAS